MKKLILAPVIAASLALANVAHANPIRCPDIPEHNTYVGGGKIKTTDATWDIIDPDPGKKVPGVIWMDRNHGSRYYISGDGHPVCVQSVGGTNIVHLSLNKPKLPYGCKDPDEETICSTNYFIPDLRFTGDVH